MYTLTSENLTHLGGPMGTEYTYPNWTKHFTTMDAAKDFAQTDYSRNGCSKKIKWSRGKFNCNSGDLRFVKYYINIVKVEA